MPAYLVTLAAQPDRIVLFVTDRAEATKERVFQTIKEMVPAVDLQAVKVPPFAMSALVEIVGHAWAERVSSRDDVVADVTGGTKPMSLALATVAFAHDQPVWYVAMQEDRILVMDRAGKSRALALPKISSVAEYLHLHGLRHHRKKGRRREPTAEEIRVARLLLDDARGPKFLEALRKNQASQRKEGSRWILAVSGRETRNLFAAYLLRSELKNVLQRTDGGYAISGTWKNYLAGPWLEDYIAHELKRSKRFTDVEKSVTVEKTASGPEHAPLENEFDVLAMAESRLLLVSCKTGKMKTADINQHLNEVRARAEELGLFVRPALVCYQFGALSETVRRRAKSMGILLLSRRQLRNLGPVLYDWTTGSQSV